MDNRILHCCINLVGLFFLIVLPQSSRAHGVAEGDAAFIEEASGSHLMHGERPNSGGAFTSCSLGDEHALASGVFTAPFDGSHGWYWENRGAETVTVVLQASGFYHEFYMP